MIAVICEESDNTDDGDAIGLIGRGKTIGRPVTK